MLDYLSSIPKKRVICGQFKKIYVTLQRLDPFGCASVISSELDDTRLARSL